MGFHLDRAMLTASQLAWVDRMRTYEDVSVLIRDDRSLTGNERALMFVLLSHMDGNGTCFPGYDLLMAETGLARATVSKCIKALVAQGWIGYGQTPTKDGRQRNHYWLAREPKFNG